MLTKAQSNNSRFGGAEPGAIGMKQALPSYPFFCSPAEISGSAKVRGRVQESSPAERFRIRTTFFFEKAEKNPIKVLL